MLMVMSGLLTPPEDTTSKSAIGIFYLKTQLCHKTSTKCIIYLVGSFLFFCQNRILAYVLTYIFARDHFIEEIYSL